MRVTGNKLYDILDEHTGEWSVFERTTTGPDGTTLTDSNKATYIDGSIYKELQESSGGGFAKRVIPDIPINIKWFGAVGNVTNINKNAGANFGKAYTNSGLTDLATDDSTAFEKAVDFILQKNKPLYERDVSAFGYRSQRHELILPPGAYYLTRSQIFSIRSGLGLTGTQSGFTIRGSGVNNTYLVYYNDSETADDWLFYDNNSYPEIQLIGLSIVCTTGKEKLIYQYSTGNSQNYSFRDISATNFKAFYKADGSANADKTDFDRIKLYTTVADATFFHIANNTQSIAHHFKNCNWAGSGTSKLFKIEAGGLITISGGSYIVEDGGTIFNVSAPAPVGSYISDANVSVSTYSSKIEVHDHSIFIDCNVSSIHINNEKTRFISNTTDNPKIILRNRGRVKFSGCSLPDSPKIAFVTDNSTYARETKPSIVFEHCILNEGYPYNKIEYYQDDALTIPFAHANIAGYGRVIVENCVTNDDNSDFLINGAPYANLGYYSYGYRKNVGFLRASPAAGRGLPNRTTPSTSITVPLRCVVCRVGIRKLATSQSGAQAVQRWHVKDGNGNTLATLTTASASEVKTVFSDDLWYDVSSEALRTLTLESDPANSDHAAEGYAMIEYI